MNVTTATSIRHTIFLQLTALPAWLALSRPERRGVIATYVAPLLAEASGTIRLRWFDAEAYSATPSDIAVVETTDLQAWSDLFEQLRDSPLWTVPYFTLERLTVSVEDGFEDYERRHPTTPT